MWTKTGDKSLGGNHIVTITAYSLSDCQEECRKRGLCRSLDYTNSTGACKLRYRLDCGNPELITDTGTDHYEYKCEGTYLHTIHPNINPGF